MTGALRSLWHNPGVKNHLQEAEALFSGLAKPNRLPPKPKTRPVPTPKVRRRAADEGAPRRRIIAGATVTPTPLEPLDDEPSGSVVKDRMSEAIASLGGVEDAEQRRARRIVAVTVDPTTPSPVIRRAVPRPEAPPISPDAYLVKVNAPEVRSDDLCFVLEGDDMAGVADRAMMQVAGYMKAEHAGAAWNLRSIERIRDLLRA